jgi:tRNA(Ile2) C34 agmatinyltransferase TiaS
MKTQVTIFLATILVLTGFNVYSQQGDKIYSVDELIQQSASLTGKTVTVKGKASHVCAQTGRKIFLETADGKQTFRFAAGKSIEKFNEDAVGKDVTITGTVTETKVYMDELDKQEAKALEAEKVASKENHCSSEAKSEGQDVKLSPVQRIQAQKEKLKKQIDKGGNLYLSFFYVAECNVYSF